MLDDICDVEDKLEMKQDFDLIEHTSSDDNNASSDNDLLLRNEVEELITELGTTDDNKKGIRGNYNQNGSHTSSV